MDCIQFLKVWKAEYVGQRQKVKHTAKEHNSVGKENCFGEHENDCAEGTYVRVRTS